MKSPYSNIVKEELRQQFTEIIDRAILHSQGLSYADKPRKMLIFGMWVHAVNWAAKHHVNIRNSNFVKVISDDRIPPTQLIELHGQPVYVVKLSSFRSMHGMQADDLIRVCGIVEKKWPL